MVRFLFGCSLLVSAVSARLTATTTSSSDSSSSSSLEHATTTTTTSYVFLQKFPLQNTNDWIFHTEVLVCDANGFSEEDQTYLNDEIARIANGSDGVDGFVDIPESWWTTQTANCTEFGYGGSMCTERCCGVPHGREEVNFPLNERRSVISNADVSEKTVYLYGKSTEYTGESGYQRLCDTPQPCWSNWKGTDYNPLTNNCNTLTSTVLHCVYGLSEKKPDLGPSDMVTVTCDRCPATENKGSDSLFLDVNTA